MTTRKTNSFFMADFASTDRRSAKAHLQGKSFRAMSFAAFSAVAKVTGRGHLAADDFKAASRFVFNRRDALKEFGQKVANLGTALLGLAAGIALYVVFVL